MIDIALKETNIAQVALKKSDTDYEVITLFQFLTKSPVERTELVVGKKVEFIDYKGGKIPLLEGLKAITFLIKKLREEGQLLSSMPA
jgi:hypothetical protein